MHNRSSVSPTDIGVDNNMQTQHHRGGSLKANYKAQVGALFRKQLLYQRRNKGQNCCLLIAPIFFCLLLLIIQTIVNNEFSKDDYKCGCECLICVNDPLRPFRTSGPEGDNPNDPCTYSEFMKCNKRNPDKCGIEYSKALQAVFCPVPSPVQYPEMIQVPAVEFRARPYSPDFPIYSTVGDGTRAEALDWAEELIPSLDATRYDRLKQALLDLRTDVFQVLLDDEAGINFLNLLKAVMNTLSTAGVPYATAIAPGGSAFIDPAWIRADQDVDNLVYILADDCGDLTLKIVDWLQEPAFRVFASILEANTTAKTGSAGGVDYTERVVLDIGAAKFGCMNGVPRNLTSISDVNNQLYCGFYESRCSGKPETNEYTLALDMTATDTAGLDYRLWFNNTNKLGGGGGGDRGGLMRVGKMMNLVSNAFMRKYYGDDYAVELQWFSEMPKPATKLSLDFSSLLGPAFFLWVLELLMPVMLQTLVYEKERRLRIMMKMHGLDNQTYITVTLLWWTIVYILYFFLLMVFGAIINLKFFRINNGGIQILTYLLHGLMQIGWAYLLSCFFKSPKTAVVFGYIYVFLSGLICSILLTRFYEKAYTWVWALELIPGFALFRGLYEFSQYAFLGSYRGTMGMMPKNLQDDQNGITYTWAINILECAVFLPLGLYLEQVMDDKTGVRRHWLFPLEWCGLKVNKSDEEARIQAAHHEAAMRANGEEFSKSNLDVAQEKERALALGPIDSEQYPIVCHGLKKIYSALDGGKPKLAVKELSMVVERGECFGLLGPNGAGKSTSISMLVGSLEPTEGTAFVEGYDIRNEMDAIYSKMGVCPQHDILWDTLTAREHLLFYGRLKNLKKEELKLAVQQALLGVNLMHAADKLVGQFSGGMKRRLSVAISFIGKPAVVYLDEPSTGLDPASRRALWDVVRANKRDKAIILTTHSMQEAEVLCDRLGIFVNGELFCLGAPKELSSRYGGYLVLTVTTGEDYNGAVQSFVKRLAPAAEISYALGGTQKFRIPLSDNLPLSRVFDAMSAQREFPCVDWAVHHASLEEVFISIAKDSGAKVNALT